MPTTIISRGTGFRTHQLGIEPVVHGLGHEPTLRERFEVAGGHLRMARVAAGRKGGARVAAREIIRARFEIDAAMKVLRAASAATTRPSDSTVANTPLPRGLQLAHRLSRELRDASHLLSSLD